MLFFFYRHSSVVFFFLVLNSQCEVIAHCHTVLCTVLTVCSQCSVTHPIFDQAVPALNVLLLLVVYFSISLFIIFAVWAGTVRSNTNHLAVRPFHVVNHPGVSTVHCRAISLQRG